MGHMILKEDIKSFLAGQALLCANDAANQKSLMAFALGKRYLVKQGNRTAYHGNSLARAVKIYNKISDRSSGSVASAEHL